MKFQIPNFSNTRVLVIGDVMLDKYWYGAASRISPEAPVPVVHVNSDEQRPGGAGNVAVNLTALGTGVDLLAMIGCDQDGMTLTEIFKQKNVTCHLQQVNDLATISKLRVLGRNQQLIRLDFEAGFKAVDKNTLFAQYQQLLPTCGVVILSDYGKGVLNDPQPFIAAAKAAGIPILVDPKHHDFSIYRGATLITPNLKEFEQVVGHCHDDNELVDKGLRLINNCQLQALLITRGAQGMTLLQRNQKPTHLPTHAKEVFDVTGAGDTVIAVMASAMAAETDLIDGAHLANTAAGVAVSKLGSATVSVPELRRALQRQQDSELGVLTEEQLLVAVEDAHAHHETVVMTNGCFDILHPGHVDYLEKAKSLGQRLIVAVNDDESVRRLKGDSRPVNTLQDRMAMLAALRAVDWVVPFSEDTPERLIAKVLPDILVKGGDWQIEQIAGHKQVLANGGEVKILKFVEGYSTTKIIERVQQ